MFLIFHNFWNIKKEVVSLGKVFAYFLNNSNTIYKVKNQPLFLYIEEHMIQDDDIYEDDMGTERKGLEKLFRSVETGDTIIVRSLVDLADTGKDLVNTLHKFQDKRVDVVSLSQEWYDGAHNLELVEDVVSIITEFSEKKRKLGMEKARKQGRIGRKPMKNRDDIEDKVKESRRIGLSVSETMNYYGISHSTYYRMIHTKDKNTDFSAFGK